VLVPVDVADAVWGIPAQRAGMMLAGQLFRGGSHRHHPPVMVGKHRCLAWISTVLTDEIAVVAGDHLKRLSRWRQIDRPDRLRDRPGSLFGLTLGLTAGHPRPRWPGWAADAAGLAPADRRRAIGCHAGIGWPAAVGRLHRWIRDISDRGGEITDRSEPILFVRRHRPCDRLIEFGRKLGAVLAWRGRPVDDRL